MLGAWQLSGWTVCPLVPWHPDNYLMKIIVLPLNCLLCSELWFCYTLETHWNWSLNRKICFGFLWAQSCRILCSIPGCSGFGMVAPWDYEAANFHLKQRLLKRLSHPALVLGESQALESWLHLRQLLCRSDEPEIIWQVLAFCCSPEGECGFASLLRRMKKS